MIRATSSRSTRWLGMCILVAAAPLTHCETSVIQCDDARPCPVAFPVCSEHVCVATDGGASAGGTAGHAASGGDAGQGDDRAGVGGAPDGAFGGAAGEGGNASGGVSGDSSVVAGAGGTAGEPGGVECGDEYPS